MSTRQQMSNRQAQCSINMKKLAAMICAITAVAGGMGRVNVRGGRSGIPAGLSMAAVAFVCVLSFCQGMADEAKSSITLTKGAIPEIAISGQVATSSDIAAAIKDTTVFKKDGDAITLLANLLIKNDAGLKIVQEKWILGDRCVIGVAGTLTIDKSEMTSVNHVLGRRGKIQARQSYQSDLVLRITDSKFSYFGGIIGIGDHPIKAGGVLSLWTPKETPIFAGNEIVHSDRMPDKIGGYIIMRFPPLFGQVAKRGFWYATDHKREGKSMAGKRKQHTDDFKARVALEAIKGFKTMSELSSAHSVHPSVIAHWKRQLLDGAAEVFSRGMGVSRTEEQLTAPLYEQIGRLKMEVEWFKKKL